MTSWWYRYYECSSAEQSSYNIILFIILEIIWPVMLYFSPFNRNTKGGGSFVSVQSSTVPPWLRTPVSQYSLRSALVTMATNWTTLVSLWPPPLSTAVLCLMVSEDPALCPVHTSPIWSVLVFNSVTFPGNHYYYLPWADTKPVVVVTSFWEDISHRLDTVNIILYIAQHLVIPHYSLDFVCLFLCTSHFKCLCMEMVVYSRN